MEKILSCLIILLCLTGCSKKNGSKIYEFESSHISDSATPVQNVEDFSTSSTMESETSVSQEELDELYKNGVSLVKGKESKKWIGDTTDPDITLPVTITNNMGITLYPEDYVVTYTMEQMGDDIEIEDCTVKKKRTKKGPEIVNGVSVEIKLFEGAALKIINPKVKLKISKEEFERRYRESNP